MRSNYRWMRLWALLAVLALAALGCKLAEGRLRVPEVQLTPAAPWVTVAVTPVDATNTPLSPLLDTPGASPATAAAALLTQPAASEAPAATQVDQPTAAPDLAASPTPTLEPFTPSPESIARQMDVFQQIWNTVNDNYLYPDFNGLDWNQVKTETQARIEAGMRDEDFYMEMYRLIRSLGDEHSTFFDPTAAAEEDKAFQGEINYAGIGLLTTPVTETLSLSVLLVFSNSPAEEAGIRMHDRILSADGQPVINEQGERVYNLRGPAGSNLSLQVQTPGQEPRTVNLVRREINAATPVPHQVLTTPGGKRIGYIFLYTFNDKTVNESVYNAMNEMAQNGPLDGYIIDNRYNSGGASTIMLNTLSYFADGRVGFFIERDQKTPLDIQGTDIGGSQTIPLVSLVGEGSGSFGEIFPGILKDLGRATLMGTTTHGNVELLSIFNFSDGSRAWLATGTFGPLNNQNANWEETGIVPDVTVESTWDAVTLETDPAIMTALRSFDQ